MEQILVTGFGPFGDIATNPSQLLAQSCGAPHRILEVSFRAVDAFLNELSQMPAQRVLHIGVAGGAEKMRIEWVARNQIGDTPDVRNEKYGPGPIDANGPPNLAASLWSHPDFAQPCEDWTPSVDAGTYLCNYVFYQALQRCPQHRVGFLHVPPQIVLSLDRQTQILASVLERLTSC